MNSNDFVTSLKKSVIDENLSIYKDLFTKTSADKISDEYWKKALTLFNSLNHEQQETVFQIIRQIMVDTTSNLLGIIDGTSYIEGTDEELELTYGKNNRLSGDLQSIFLASEES